MNDGMKAMTMKLPPPRAGLVWAKFIGDMPGEFDYITDADGAFG